MSSGAERKPTGSPEVGARLKAARQKHGLTQTELAREIGASKAAVSQWESGMTAIERRRAILLSHTLGIPVTELLDLPSDGLKEDSLFLELVHRLDARTRGALLLALAGWEPNSPLHIPE